MTGLNVSADGRQTDGGGDGLAVLVDLLEVGVLEILGDLPLAQLVLAARLGDEGHVGVLRQRVAKPLER